MIAKFGTFEYALAERYRFEDELGRGAMGIVYRATDVRLGRPVAIKLLHPALTNELGVARFQSEIRIAASLHHPNIVGVHDSGESDGRLFYVMDYLGGETLRARLEREKQLSVDDALSIVEQVAAGLQYAHDHGIVHRDVKPENILVVDGRACIMDFGLARALSGMDTQRLTASGLAVGTPHYLSPEQASAEKEVGPKADQYALACVLYEMLAGEPPFTGPTASAIAMRHISEQPAPLRLRRRSAPEAVEAAVKQAMEKVPGDRFDRISQFNTALTLERVRGADTAFQPPKSRWGRKQVGFALLVGALATTLLLAAKGRVESGVHWLMDGSLDSTRYVVLPGRTSTGGLDPHLSQGVATALSAWSGVSVVGEQELRAVLLKSTNGPFDAQAAISTARALRARYVISVEPVPGGDQSSLQAEIRDARAQRATGVVRVRLDASLNRDSLMAHVAYALLFANSVDASREEAAAEGTRNKRAFDAFLRGAFALRSWNLRMADSAFASASQLDVAFPQALLNLARVRHWRGATADEFSALLVRTHVGASELSEREHAHLAAMQSIASGAYEDACKRYNALVSTDSMDLAGWYGIGECNSLDSVVVDDPRSRSRLSFRGSFHAAQRAYSRAFELLPLIDSVEIARVDSLLRTVLMTSNTDVRLGRGKGAASSRSFGAYPEWDGDTLAFVPYPTAPLFRGDSQTVPASHAVAIEQMRLRNLSIASRRARAYHSDPGALEELAGALELVGDPSAVDTVRRAQRLATEPSARLRLATKEAWLRLRAALPDNPNALRAVRATAESLLTTASVHSASDAGGLGGLAALIGDDARAARYAEQSAAMSAFNSPLPREVLTLSRVLLAYAASAGPIDSLTQVEVRLRRAIANGVVPGRQAFVIGNLLGRPAALAFPVKQFESLSGIDSTGDYLIAAERQFVAGRYANVRTTLADVAKTRRALRPGDLTLEAVYPEAWLLAAVGDTSGALNTLGDVLDAIGSVPTKQFADIANAGSFVQATMLRAELLRRTGKAAEGRTWRAVVEALTDTVAVQGRMRMLRLRTH